MYCVAGAGKGIACINQRVSLMRCIDTLLPHSPLLEVCFTLGNHRPVGEEFRSVKPETAHAKLFDGPVEAVGIWDSVSAAVESARAMTRQGALVWLPYECR